MILDHTIKKISGQYPYEILVVDAMSIDNTIQTVLDFSLDNLKTYSDHSLRYRKFASLNKGVELSRGDVLIFLDADTLVPQDFDRLLIAEIEKGFVGGAFELDYNNKPFPLKLILAINRFRYKYSKHFYGDQVFFCNREAFQKVGGYPKVTILETAAICKKLKKIGKLSLIPQRVISSSRRFIAGGVINVFFQDIEIWLKYKLRLPTSRLGTKYWKQDKHVKKVF